MIPRLPSSVILHLGDCLFRVFLVSLNEYLDIWAEQLENRQNLLFSQFSNRENTSNKGLEGG